MAKANEFRFDKFNFKDLISTPEALPLVDTILLYHKGGKFFFLDSSGHEEQIISISDIVTEKKAISFYIDDVLEVGTNQMSIIVPQAMTIKDIRLMVDTAPTGAALIIDLNKNETTLYSTQANRPTIAISGTSATAALPDVVSLAVGDKLTLDIDQIGSTVAGENLSVIVICEVA